MNDIEQLLETREKKTAQRKKRAVEKPKDKPVKAKKPSKKELQIKEMASNTTLPDHYEMIWTLDELSEMIAWLETQTHIAVDTETMGVNPWVDEIVGISFYAPHRGYYIPLKHIDDVGDNVPEEGVVGVDYVRCLPKELVKYAIKPLLENLSKKFLFHNFKFDYHVLRIWMDIKMVCYFDTMIAQALLDENQSKALKDLAPFYLKVDADKFSTLFGKETFDKIPILIHPELRTGCLGGYYAIKDTELTFKLAQFQSRAMERKGLEKIKKLMYELEMPFLHIVARAEARGVKLDIDYLARTVAPQLHAEVEALRLKIWNHTGEINLNSPAQLSQALYVKLKLPKVNKDKPESTDKKTLKKLKKEHEVIGLLLDYREKVKLTTAFADKLQNSAVMGRVHTSFNSVGTKTGRMSSNSPNLQQIPSKVGGLIRNAFIADDGRLLVSIDYSGQELRVLAHIAQCPVMMDLFLTGKDVHAMTATGMWNRKNPDKQVSYEYFEYCRAMTGEFQDADGDIVHSRFTDQEVLAGLIEKGVIEHTDPDKLLEEVKLGKQFEKFRKDAKVVNFGRPKKLCRSKTSLKTMKATA